MALQMPICGKCCRKISEHYSLIEYLEDPQRELKCQLCYSVFTGRPTSFSPIQRSYRKRSGGGERSRSGQ